VILGEWDDMDDSIEVMLTKEDFENYEKAKTSGKSSGKTNGV
jgi:hypothetical protein